MLTNRAARSFARLGLESLEGRVLLSTTLPAAPAPATGLVQQAAAMSIQHHSSTASYSYNWSIAPRPVLTGVNPGTGNTWSGSVLVALYRPGTGTATLGGAANTLRVGLVNSNSSATAARPDHFNTTFALTLHIRDEATGALGAVTFKASINGTLSMTTASLKVTFQGPLARQVKVGNHIYTVTIKTGTLHVPASGTRPALIGATIAVSNARRT
jgi:hypothetical protein